MKTPTTPFTILALALAGLATQALAIPSDLPPGNSWSSPDDTLRTSDGKIIMPDDFVGPLAPNQIYKKDAGTAELGSFAATTNALHGIGKLQCSDSGIVTPDPEIVAYEDRMKAQAEKEKEKKETAAQDKKMFSGNMFAEDNGGDQNTPAAAPQDPPQDSEKVAALETGAGIGDFLRNQWRQSPDSGSGGIGGDIGAGGSGAGEVGKIEAETLNVSNIPLTYEHNIRFESKIPERIEGLKKALEQGSSGKDDLAPNTVPSKGVVATHQ